MKSEMQNINDYTHYVISVSMPELDINDIPMKYSYNTLKRIIREVLKEEGVINE